MKQEPVVTQSADRPDVKERILKMFEAVQDRLKTMKNVADISSGELERLADHGEGRYGDEKKSELTRPRLTGQQAGEARP